MTDRLTPLQMVQILNELRCLFDFETTPEQSLASRIVFWRNEAARREADPRKEPRSVDPMPPSEREGPGSAANNWEQLAHRHEKRADAEKARADRLASELKRHIEGWSNAVELSLLPDRHIATAVALRDSGRAALASEGGDRAKA